MAEAIGVSIGENKAYLIDSRLSPIVADTGARDLLDLIAKAKADPSRRLHDRIVDALTTHETFWFRDERAWAALREAALPSLVTAFRASGRPKFRIWCAACSTGQEPYTLAMLLDTLCSEGRLGGLAPAQIELLATDVRTGHAQKAAAAGQYNAVEIQRGLADVWKNKYFAPVPGGDRWVIAESLRRRVSFKRFNLGYRSDCPSDASISSFAAMWRSILRNRSATSSSAGCRPRSSPTVCSCSEAANPCSDWPTSTPPRTWACRSTGAGPLCQPRAPNSRPPLARRPPGRFQLRPPCLRYLDVGNFFLTTFHEPPFHEHRPRRHARTGA